ncbi:hypothetical protein CW705_02835 [Candidatus Bathyarchaeota archaeon]|nr:MAG: hypothetical protein CW705_02835 [Candidatus Bathyarchaeota archaeon]
MTAKGVNYPNVFKKELGGKTVNLRSCDTLFSLFLGYYPKMKLGWDDDRRRWTVSILNFFAELGKFYGYQVWLKPDYGVRNINNKETREWLVDLCWYFEAEYFTAHWVELALESELSSQTIDDILYDFWKLTDIKAFMKVGIFAPKLSKKESLLQELIAVVAQHGIKIPTEKYLIILILYHGKVEDETKRIEIDGYEINYLGDFKRIGSKRFPVKPL